MYRLRQMDVDDKVCEQVSMTMLNAVYPKEVIERCVQQSEPWSTKARRVGARTALALGRVGVGGGLWRRLNQCRGGEKLGGKRSPPHPAEQGIALSGSGPW